MRRHLRWLGTAALTAAVGAALSVSGGAGSATRADAAPPRADDPPVVRLSRNRFISDFTIVPVGATVTFRNDESDPDDVHDVCAEAGSVVSPAVAPGGSWSYTFASEGFWHNLCS